MNTEILKIIDENIVILFDTLNNFSRMNTKGIDPTSSAFFRRIKKELISKTKEDINQLLTYKKNYEAKIIQPVLSEQCSAIHETHEPMQVNGAKAKEDFAVCELQISHKV